MDNINLSAEEVKKLKALLNNNASSNIGTVGGIGKLTSLMGSMAMLLEFIQNPGVQKLLKIVEESADSLAELIALVTKYQKAGTIKNALELVAFVTVIKDALATDSVARLASSAANALVIWDQVFTEIGGLETIKKVVDQLQLQGLATSLEE